MVLQRSLPQTTTDPQPGETQIPNPTIDSTLDLIHPDRQTYEALVVPLSPTPLNKKRPVETSPQPKELSSQSDNTSVPNEDNQNPTALKPSQSALPTQPTEASASSQVPRSNPKPPDWDAMTASQKSNWRQRYKSNKVGDTRKD